MSAGADFVGSESVRAVEYDGAFSGLKRENVNLSGGVEMRKCIIVIAVTLAALTVPIGTAVASATTLTASGKAIRETPQGSQWAVHAPGFQAVRATELYIHVGNRTECSWQFIFQTISSGMYQDSQINTAVYHRPAATKTTVIDRIVSGTGQFTHARGSVRIAFRSAKSASFSFHLDN